MQAVREDSLSTHELALRMRESGMTHREIATALAIPIHHVPIFLRAAEGKRA
jgi:hypothetical protein